MAGARLFNELKYPKRPLLCVLAPLVTLSPAFCQCMCKFSCCRVGQAAISWPAISKLLASAIFVGSLNLPWVFEGGGQKNIQQFALHLVWGLCTYLSASTMSVSLDIFSPTLNRGHLFSN